MGGSPGLVVMGDDSYLRVCGFEPLRRILDGHFSHWFVVKMYCLFEKTEKTKKEAGLGPFKKNIGYNLRKCLRVTTVAVSSTIWCGHSVSEKLTFLWYFMHVLFRATCRCNTLSTLCHTIVNLIIYYSGDCLRYDWRAVWPDLAKSSKSWTVFRGFIYYLRISWTDFGKFWMPLGKFSLM